MEANSKAGVHRFIPDSSREVPASPEVRGARISSAL
jgi:hypothetical protein